LGYGMGEWISGGWGGRAGKSKVGQTNRRARRLYWPGGVGCGVGALGWGGGLVARGRRGGGCCVWMGLGEDPVGAVGGRCRRNWGVGGCRWGWGWWVGGKEGGGFGIGAGIWRRSWGGLCGGGEGGVVRWGWRGGVGWVGGELAGDRGAGDSCWGRWAVGGGGGGVGGATAGGGCGVEGGWGVEGGGGASWKV